MNRDSPIARLARSTLCPALALTAVAMFGTSGCGGEKCGSEFYGGGDFTLTLTGGIEGVLRGTGFGESQLGIIPDVGELERIYGVSEVVGSTLHLSLGQDVASFGGLAEFEAGTLEGCPDATFAAFSVLDGSLQQTMLLLGTPRPETGLRYATITQHLYDGWSTTGALNGEFGGRTPLVELDREGGHCMTSAVNFELEWRVDERVRLKAHESCEGGFGWSN